MHSLRQNGAPTQEPAKIAETEAEIAAIRRHLKEVIEGAAFKGSYRSGQFLKYIVEQSIAGRFDSLKERVIGVELFGRSTSYDTGGDSIVRVTASDVRKRLLRHYGRYGAASAFRISLPLGSYIPEIVRDPYEASDHQVEALPQPSVPLPEVPVAVSPFVAVHPDVPGANRRRSGHWVYFAIFLVLLNLAAVALVWAHFSRAEAAAKKVLPWSAFFASPHVTLLITSDPNMEEIENFTGEQISVSDYANHNYIPNPNALSPELQRFCRVILRGDKASSVDTPIAVNVALLAPPGSRRMTVRAARGIQFSDLQTDRNLILLGSPRSNPWAALFNDQLDFRFVFDKVAGQEFIRNVHPQPGELLSYIPTALGWATGQSFATISFVQSPDQDGQVLLLAGANAEGTAAAGKLVTDLPRLAAVLQKCGIAPSGPLRHFQLLLHLNTMAGSPTNFDVQACHILPGSLAH